MKKVLLFLLICGYHVLVNAQYQKWSADYIPLSKYKVLDNAHLKFTYEFTHLFDTLDNSSRRSEICALLIGNKYSEYYSQTYVDYCIKKEAGQAKEPLPPQGASGLEILKGYPKQGEMTVMDLGSELNFGANLMYEEKVPAIAWKIESDTTRILYYLCQRATGDFRGRHYDVWFTPEIPIPNGPWKLGGLPGLILKAEDSKHDITFECLGVERLVEREVTKLYDRKEVIENVGGEAIKMYDANFKKVTRKEYQHILPIFLEDPEKYWFDNNIGNTTGRKIPPIPYDPMEKD